MKRFAFPRKARLVREQEFRRVYRGGRRFTVSPLRFSVQAQRQGGSRLGLAVGRKTGNAVVRNRWKRAVREAFRLQRHALRAPHDIVVAVDWEARPEDVARVPEAFRKAIELMNAREEGGA